MNAPDPAVVEDHGKEPKIAVAAPPPERRDIRCGILEGTRFVTRQSSYEDSLFATWERIKVKYSRYGFAHIGGKKLFDDTEGIAGGKAFLEMYAELRAFIYELAGNVNEDKYKDSVAAVRRFFEDEVRAAPYLERIPLMYSKAENLFHNADIGLRKPPEKGLFDVDVKAVFRAHYARVFSVRQPTADEIAVYVDEIVIEPEAENEDD